MMEHVVFLAVAYCFLTALLALLVLRTALNPPIKFIAVIATAIFAYVSYGGWKDAQGWPTGLPVPEDFLLHHSVVNEPNSQTGDNGAIFIWLSSTKDDIPSAEPRVHRLPYTLEMHKKLEQAKRNQENGQPQVGQRRPPPGAEEAANKLSTQNADIAFRNLPESALPEK